MQPGPLGVAIKAKKALDSVQARRYGLYMMNANATPQNPPPPAAKHHVNALSLADAAKFVGAGRATFTVVSLISGVRFTFRVARSMKDKEKTGPLFVSVLTGASNTTDYTYLGCIFADGCFKKGKKCSLSDSAPSLKAFAWFWAHLGTPAQTQCEVYHAGKCGRCGRLLSVPESVTSGIGPECKNKL